MTAPKEERNLSVFAAALQRERKIAGVTHEELANEVGCTTRAIISYESGVRYPTVERLIAIADSLVCSADDLIGGISP